VTGRGKNRALMALAAAVLALQGCSGEDAAEDATAEASTETLASLIMEADGLSTVAGVIGEAGLAQVFDGAASYTLLAPQDAAFEALGEAGEELRSAAQRPAMVAILRDHIVPGYLTPEDIANAIEAADDGSVEMRTMGGHVVTFTGDGETVTVTAEDGATARFAGDALRGSNGAAIPLDGVLRKVGETPEE
jgi:uncharacterized surface protein with fasciclin (FAS1) repeats